MAPGGWLVFASLLLLFAASLRAQQLTPVLLPGERFEDQVDESDGESVQATDNQPTPESSVTKVEEAEQAIPAGQNRREVADEHEQNPADFSVRIVEQAGIRRDWFDYVTNGLLILIALLQLWLIFGTLRATAVAADAARTSANATLGSECAYVAVISVVHSGEYFGVRVRNVGRTVAFIEDVAVRVVPTSIKNIHNRRVPDDVLVHLFNSRDLASDKEMDLETSAKAEVAVGEDINKHLLLISGFVIYKDVFGRRFQVGFGWKRDAHVYTWIPYPEFDYRREITAEQQLAQRERINSQTIRA